MKNLTLRYSLTQFSYWAASTGATSFATAYLLERGLSAGTVGIMLAASGLLSCLTQPVLAAAVDKAKRFALVKTMVVLSAICAVCLAAQVIPCLPTLAAGIVYIMGMWLSDVMSPFLNALSVSYNGAGHIINYGIARSIGSVASAVSSLVLGFVIAKLGSAWMVAFLVGFRVVSIIVIAGYPKIEKKSVDAGKRDGGCSILAFFGRYKWYCVSLLGVLFLGMYHAMTENYLIAIMERLGGDSSHVGRALFISAMSGAAAIFFIGEIRSRICDTWLLKIAAISFLIKAVLFCFARSITAIYIFQLFQMTSYAFLAPAQVYYANAKVQPADMVKGQAFITAAYALGCSAGNFTGGQALKMGVDALLVAGIIMCVAGTALLFFAVDKKDMEA